MRNERDIGTQTMPQRASVEAMMQGGDLGGALIRHKENVAAAPQSIADYNGAANGERYGFG